MCIDNCRQIDLPSINLFFEDRSYSAKTCQICAQYGSIRSNLLRRIRWINDDGVFSLVILHKIGVIVAGPGP